jgi:hypothetical protein
MCAILSSVEAVVNRLGAGRSDDLAGPTFLIVQLFRYQERCQSKSVHFSQNAIQFSWLSDEKAHNQPEVRRHIQVAWNTCHQ